MKVYQAGLNGVIKKAIDRITGLFNSSPSTEAGSDRYGAAYLLGTRLCFIPKSKTVFGMHIEHGPLVSLDVKADKGEIGRKMRTMLRYSKSNISHPTSRRFHNEEYYALFGVESWKSLFNKIDKSVSIDQQGSEYAFTPMIKVSIKDGLRHDDATKVTIRTDDDSALAEALLQALNNSR